MTESLRASLIGQFGKQCGMCGRCFCRLTVEPIAQACPVSFTNCVLLCEPCIQRREKFAGKDGQVA